jgi:hypothetical protein
MIFETIQPHPRQEIFELLSGRVNQGRALPEAVRNEARSKSNESLDGLVKELPSFLRVEGQAEVIGKPKRQNLLIDLILKQSCITVKSFHVKSLRTMPHTLEGLGSATNTHLKIRRSHIYLPYFGTKVAAQHIISIHGWCGCHDLGLIVQFKAAIELKNGTFDIFPFI